MKSNTDRLDIKNYSTIHDETIKSMLNGKK